jgi:transcriptional regulator with XRE-family HTH domain
LHDIRENKNIPQEELAAFSGLTRSSIANIEKGKQRVLLHQLVFFARRLEVGLAELLPEAGAALSAAEAELEPGKLAYLQQVKLSANLSPKEPSRAKKKKRKKS